MVEGGAHEDDIPCPSQRQQPNSAILSHETLPAKQRTCDGALKVWEKTNKEQQTKRSEFNSYCTSETAWLPISTQQACVNCLRGNVEDALCALWNYKLRTRRVDALRAGLLDRLPEEERETSRLVPNRRCVIVITVSSDMGWAQVSGAARSAVVWIICRAGASCGLGWRSSNSATIGCGSFRISGTPGDATSTGL